MLDNNSSIDRSNRINNIIFGSWMLFIATIMTSYYFMRDNEVFITNIHTALPYDLLWFFCQICFLLFGLQYISDILTRLYYSRRGKIVR